MFITCRLGGNFSLLAGVVWVNALDKYFAIPFSVLFLLKDSHHKIMDNSTEFENMSIAYDKEYSLYMYDTSAVPQWAKWTVMTYLLFVMVFGVTGNGLLILVQTKNKNKTSTDYLIFAMAVVEFVTSSVYTSFNICRQVNTVWKKLASAVLCKLLTFLGYQLGMSSIFLITAIAVDRYIKTCKPWNTTYTKKSAKTVSIAILLTGTLIGLPIIPTHGVDKGLNCVHKEPFIRTYQRLMSLLTFIALVVDFCAYVNVGLEIRKRHRLRLKRWATLSYSDNSVSAPRTKAKSWRSITYRSGQKKVAPADYKNTHYMNSTASTHIPSIANPAGTSTADEFTKEGDNHSQTSLDTIKAMDQTEIISPPKQSNVLLSLKPCASGQINSKRWREDLHLNRTTLTLFLITFVYVITFVLQWLFVIPVLTPLGPVPRYFAMFVNLINCITNPLFIFGLNSRCRNEVRALICSPKTNVP